MGSHLRSSRMAPLPVQRPVAVTPDGVNSGMSSTSLQGVGRWFKCPRAKSTFQNTLGQLAAALKVPLNDLLHDL